VAFSDPRFAVGVLFAGAAIFAAVELGPVPTEVQHTIAGVTQMVAPGGDSGQTGGTPSFAGGAGHGNTAPATASGGSRNTTSSTDAAGGRATTGTSGTSGTTGTSGGSGTSGTIHSGGAPTTGSPASGTTTSGSPASSGGTAKPGGGTTSTGTGTVKAPPLGTFTGTSSTGSGSPTTVPGSPTTVVTVPVTTTTTAPPPTTTTTAPPPPPPATPQQLVAGVLVQLGSVPSTDPHLKDAIQHLNQALAAAWPSGPVFDNIQQAITSLMGLPNQQAAWNLPGDEATLDGATRQIAVAAITANSCNAANPKALTTAQNELSAGDTAAAAGHPDQAVGHYKNAWNNAVAAKGTSC
jgi:hypothetical protein